MPRWCICPNMAANNLDSNGRLRDPADCDCDRTKPCDCLPDVVPSTADLINAEYHTRVERTSIPVRRWRASVTGQGLIGYTIPLVRYGRTRASAVARITAWCDTDRKKALAAMADSTTYRAGLDVGGPGCCGGTTT